MGFLISLIFDIHKSAPYTPACYPKDATSKAAKDKILFPTSGTKSKQGL